MKSGVSYDQLTEDNDEEETEVCEPLCDNLDIWNTLPYATQQKKYSGMMHYSNKLRDMQILQYSYQVQTICSIKESL